MQTACQLKLLRQTMQLLGSLLQPLQLMMARPAARLHDDVTWKRSAQEVLALPPWQVWQLKQTQSQTQ